ncbi:vitamin K epoxide reductase family protein [Pseudohongiella sp.]|uniref:vitamin K epoxide reductase family protein n=1 Tax=Pseudohongiella sp. TaxID=1979412 RepID=UPI001851F0E0|nr:vitamin K epoxide reductase family protein [Pseudohongiella sp.]HDZ08988.1 NAD-dependent epimerase/dehydratase family protein [Pseudohongiella sp.]HEA62673.1 NAD-dependent epimerase/dehydratase family protein [Pseudohongiella sp.]
MNIKPLVLITGSNGNIGTALRRKLKSDYDVVGIDVDDGKHTDIVADLTSTDSMTLAFRDLADRHGKKIAAVIHLAAYFDFTGVKSPLYDKVNVEGTRNLLSALTDFNVERFIYSGTMLVHQAGSPGERVNESTPIAPKWAYPESKAETEAVIRENSGDMPFTLLHLAGLYDDNTAVPTLAHQIARIYERDMKAHLHSGDQDAGQSFIHLDDMLDLFKRCIDRRNDLPADATVLAGEPDVMSYRQLQDELGRLIHGAEVWRTLSLPEPIAKAGAWMEEKSEPVVPDAIDHGEKPFIRPFLIDLASDHYALDITQAKHLLGWEPSHSIGKKLEIMVKNLKKDPVAWYRNNGIRPPDWLVNAEEKTDKPEVMRQRHETWYRDEHARNIWGALFNIALGFWLIASIPRLGYESQAMAVSDIVSGIAIVILASLSLSWRLPLARWATAAVGLWVMTAPLVFWSPSAAVYLNGSVVGFLVVALSVALRPAPGLSPLAVMTGPTVPPGWKYSPSSWLQRLPIIILAFIGFFISAYMAAYQLGHVDTIWEPFFAGALPGDGKNGTGEIITSSISEAWPVPDAGAGAMVYLLEILVGVIGSSQRWRTMPWLTILFGILIVPLGAVSITFIIIQPILLDTWCTLCLMAAAAMLLQIPFSVDELVATGQFLLRRKREGHSVLRAFIFGDTDEGKKGRQDDAVDDFQRSPIAIIKDMFTGGVRLCYGLIACIAVGALLMLTRLLLGAQGGMADAHHLIGALIMTVSVTALAEVARPLRFLNLFLALGLMICALVLEGSLLVTIATLVAGVIVMAASIPRGPVNGVYGSWSRLIV